VAAGLCGDRDNVRITGQVGIMRSDGDTMVVSPHATTVMLCLPSVKQLTFTGGVTHCVMYYSLLLCLVHSDYHCLDSRRQRTCKSIGIIAQ